MFDVLTFCCSAISYFLFNIFVFSSYIHFLFFINQGVYFTSGIPADLGTMFLF